MFALPSYELFPFILNSWLESQLPFDSPVVVARYSEAFFKCFFIFELLLNNLYQVLIIEFYLALEALSTN